MLSVGQKTILWCLLVGLIVSIPLPLLVERFFPRSSAVVGYVLLPGMLAGGLFAPQGIHTGGLRTTLFGYFVLVFNLGFYSLLAYPFVELISFLRLGGQNRRER